MTITGCFDAQYVSKSFSRMVGAHVPVFSLYGAAWGHIGQAPRRIFHRLEAARKRKNQPLLRDAGFQNGAIIGLTPERISL